jgi:hypothetical protein
MVFEIMGISCKQPGRVIALADGGNGDVTFFMEDAYDPAYAIASLAAARHGAGPISDSR